MPPAPFWLVAVWVVAGVAKVVVLDLVCLVSWVCCLVLFWCVWLVWWVCFLLFFLYLERILCGCFFFICFSFFHGLLELGGHFFGDFGVLGSSLDAFGARGVQGADLVEIVRSTEAFWLHFGVIFGVKR